MSAQKECSRIIAKGGRAFVGLAAIATVIALPLQIYVGIGLLVLTAFLVFVFRDPSRTIGVGIVAPADGVVREVNRDEGLVSTYLALRNVHVTRAPVDGTVEKAEYVLGKHKPAFSKGSPGNERLEISLKSDFGDVSIIEMTGAIARRIVPYIAEGRRIGKGEKLSLIRFGSRVDLRLPPRSVRIVVEKGQRLRAGVTQIAEVVHDRAE